MQDHTNDILRPPELSIVAGALDNNDMHATMNLEGPQCSSFVTQSSVDIMDLTVRFSPERCWLPVGTLSADMVICGRRRCKDGGTFFTLRKMIMNVDWSCADVRIKDGILCLKVEPRRGNSADIVC